MIRKASRVYFVVLWAILLTRIVAFLWRGWSALHYPFELDYGEGVIIWQAQHVTSLRLAYHSLLQLPYMVFHYPPLYHLASRAVQPITGDLLIAGRLVSILSTLGISALSGLIVREALPAKMPRLVRATGVMAAAGLCFSVESLGWAVYMRVDMFALCLEFAGIYLYLRGRLRPALEYAAFACFFLALYAKQTVIAGPLACGAVATLVSPRRGVRLVTLLAGCAGATLIALVWATDGQFLRHVFLYNRNPLSVATLVSILRPNILAMGAIAGAALAWPVSYAMGVLSRPPGGRLTRFRAAMRNSGSHRFVAVGGMFLVLAMAVSLTAAKSGASRNYMLEWNLAACPLAAMLLAGLLYGWRRLGRLPPASAAILLSPLLYANALGGLQTGALILEDADGRQMKSAAAVLERIREAPGPVYSNDMVLLYRAGKEVVAEPAIMSVLAERGQWDDAPFVSRVDAGYFDLIVVSRFPLSERLMFSPAVAAAIARVYEPTERVGAYTLYRRR